MRRDLGEARVIGQRNAAVEEQLVNILQPELSSKDCAGFGRRERFSEKNSRDQLWNMPKNNFHAQDGPVTLA